MREEPTEPTSEEFEDFVAAALRVDPKGLSGKHKSDRDDSADELPGRDRNEEEK